MKTTTYENVPAGNPELLGATPLGQNRGTNFAVYAGRDATNVKICVLDRDINPRQEIQYNLTAKEAVYQRDGSIIGNVWHGVAAEVGAGALYGIRVNGPADQFNGQKLLVDPAAMAVTGPLHSWTDTDRMCNQQNNASDMVKGIVVDYQALYDRVKKRGAIYPHADTRVLEVHVKGSTILHPAIPEDERGRFKGLAHRDFIDWVKDMGFTSLELMPVAAFGTHPMFADKGMQNYWGYEPFAPMAPHPDYALNSLSAAAEFANAVAKLRAEGIETILDVVPNHTLEKSWRDQLVINLHGMDSSLYFYGDDYTGTGNTCDFGHPMNVGYFLRQLKHWEALGVAGVRIDLAAVIGREHGRGFDSNSLMMEAIRNDPDLLNFKFSGEPWHINYRLPPGTLSYAPRSSPPNHNRIAEWDGEYRDDMQRIAFGKKDIKRSVIIRSIAGYDIEPSERVLKIGSHDGATLSDMVTYIDKVNKANGEDNRDGNEIHGNNNIRGEFYWGNDSDRTRVKHFALSLLFISQGTPMMTHGHERDHTQNGNTNPFSQDNEITHIEWNDAITPEGRELTNFTRSCLQFRAAHFSLRRARLFTGKPDEDAGLKFNGSWMKDVTWLDPMGNEICGTAMDQPGGFAMMLSGDPGNSPPDEKNRTRLVQRKERDSPLLILINPLNGDDLRFTLPFVEGVGLWTFKSNSFDDPAVPKNSKFFGGQEIKVAWRSAMIFEGVRVNEPVQPKLTIPAEGRAPV